ncbi:hypothetical protein BC826DRAFT_680193 [Russula brevipes]|nr:hypothetical protein BC826DRAFT_680193 [Russula brevipes]
MKCAVFLVVISTALVAVANPSHSIISALLLRQSGRGLYVRSGVDVSGIDKACQPSCTDVITTLNVSPSFDLRAFLVRVPGLTAELFVVFFFPLSVLQHRGVLVPAR